MKPRWFLKIAWENFVVNNLPFFYVRIVKGSKTNIFTCKLCARVIFIILFTSLLCDNSNSLTYEPRKGAKSNTFTGSFENEALENEALENEDRSMKHPNLENEAPRSRKRSTQNSKTEHPNLENEAPKTRKESTLNWKPVCPLKTRDSPLSSHQQQESSTITKRMQFKTIQVELRGVANAFPSPWLLAISELRRTLGRVSDLNYR